MDTLTILTSFAHCEDDRAALNSSLTNWMKRKQNPFFRKRPPPVNTPSLSLGSVCPAALVMFHFGPEAEIEFPVVIYTSTRWGIPRCLRKSSELLRSDRRADVVLLWRAAMKSYWHIYIYRCVCVCVCACVRAWGIISSTRMAICSSHCGLLLFSWYLICIYYVLIRFILLVTLVKTA